MGLSSGHISPWPSVRWNPAGQSIKLQIPLPRHPENQSAQAPRGLIREFSRKSRSRMLQTLGELDKVALEKALLVTLTYPREWPAEMVACKRHLVNLFKRVRRETAKVSAVWKLEYQKRGAPHFHLLVLGAPFIDHEWLAQAWYEVVDSGDPNHLKAGTQVAPLKKADRAIFYVGKYMSKIDKHEDIEDEDLPGRIWGVMGRENLPQELRIETLSHKEVGKLMRVVSRLAHAQNRSQRRHPHLTFRIMDGREVSRLVDWAKT